MSWRLLLSWCKTPTHTAVLTARGFTLVELMVTISIMVLVTSAVLVRHTSFNSAVLLENQAYEIAFDIRQTQLLAVSARGRDADFRQTFSIEFEPGQRTYQIYQGTFLYGAPGALDRRFEITSVSGGSEGNPARIEFRRPNFDAIFDDSLDTFIITIAPVNGTGERTIEVTRTGQITVQ